MKRLLTNSGILLVQGKLPEPNPTVQEFLDDKSIIDVTIFGGLGTVSSEMKKWFKGRFNVR